MMTGMTVPLRLVLPVMPSSSSISILAPFGSTPADLLLEIAGYLECRADLLSLCLTVSESDVR